MSPRNTSDNVNPFLRPSAGGRWLRGLVVLAVLLVVAGVALRMVWYTFYTYVPPGKMLVVISKNGQPLASGQVLADSGQKGVQKGVLGEGWHTSSERPDERLLELNSDVQSSGPIPIVNGDLSIGGSTPAQRRHRGRLGENRLFRHPRQRTLTSREFW